MTRLRLVLVGAFVVALAACGGTGGTGGGTDTNSKKCQKHPQYLICQGGGQKTTPSS